MMGAAGSRQAATEQMAAIEETSARSSSYPASPGGDALCSLRGDRPPCTPRHGGRSPPISPPRRDLIAALREASETASPPALWLGLSLWLR